MPDPKSFRLVTLLLFAFFSLASAQISVPTFGTREGVPPELRDAFMRSLRQQIAQRTGLMVREGELITEGIAGSLDPVFTALIAELDGARFAVSGELRPSPDPRIQAPFLVNLLVVDAAQERTSDLISRPLAADTIDEVAASIAVEIEAFTKPITMLPAGDAGLFVSSEPSQADVFIDGLFIGTTSQLDVVMLAPGRYQLELRKEGFLPETRTIELRDGDVSFVHVIMTAISGGIIQVDSTPPARVFFDEKLVGVTPLSLSALPGVQTLRLERDGFKPVTFSVKVINFKVSRVDLVLEPIQEPLVFWKESREYLIFVGPVLQTRGYAENLSPGPVTFTVRRGAEVQHFDVVVPPTGVYEFDPETGELTQIETTPGGAGARPTPLGAPLPAPGG